MSPLVPAEIWTVAKTDQGNAILVKPVDGEKAVPIFIGPLEAQNILLGLGEVEIPRPLTHDLILQLFSELKTVPVRVDIHTLSEGTFFSNLVLDQAGHKIEIDARPSDALALAVRAKIPIFLAEDLIDEVGVSLDQLRQASSDGSWELEGDEDPDQSEESESGVATDLLDELQQRLDKAVADENYEEAARIRDDMERLR